MRVTLARCFGVFAIGVVVFSTLDVELQYAPSMGKPLVILDHGCVGLFWFDLPADPQNAASSGYPPCALFVDPVRNTRTFNPGFQWSIPFAVEWTLLDLDDIAMAGRTGPRQAARLVRFSVLVPLAMMGGVVLLVVNPYYFRRRRRERGCCEICGYDLRGAAQLCCPECGSLAVNLIDRQC